MIKAEDLSEFLSYDEHSGLFTWKKRDRSFFKEVGHWKAWNSRFAEKEALTAIHAKGYKCGQIFSNLYLAHRVAWAIASGSWPNDQIDHINGIKTDNRMINLRCVSNMENHLNMPLRSDNKSGVHGVTFDKRYNMWQSRATSQGKKYHLGYFHDHADAVKARKKIESALGFHENHGRIK